jgi:hypothetical protein
MSEKCKYVRVKEYDADSGMGGMGGGMPRIIKLYETSHIEDVHMLVEIPGKYCPHCGKEIIRIRKKVKEIHV